MFILKLLQIHRTLQTQCGFPHLVSANGSIVHPFQYQKEEAGMSTCVHSPMSSYHVQFYVATGTVHILISQGRISLPLMSMRPLDYSGRMAGVPLVNFHQQDSGKYTCTYCQREAPLQGPASEILLVVMGEKKVS